MLLNLLLITMMSTAFVEGGCLMDLFRRQFGRDTTTQTPPPVYTGPAEPEFDLLAEQTRSFDLEPTQPSAADMAASGYNPRDFMDPEARTEEEEPTPEQKPAPAQRRASTDPQTIIEEIRERNVWLPSECDAAQQRCRAIEQELYASVAARKQRQAKADAQMTELMLQQIAEFEQSNKAPMRTLTRKEIQEAAEYGKSLFDADHPANNVDHRDNIWQGRSKLDAQRRAQPAAGTWMPTEAPIKVDVFDVFAEMVAEDQKRAAEAEQTARAEAGMRAVIAELTKNQAEQKARAEAAQTARAEASMREVIAELTQKQAEQAEQARMGAWAKRNACVLSETRMSGPVEKRARTSAPVKARPTCTIVGPAESVAAPVDPTAWTEVKQGRGISDKGARDGALYKPTRIDSKTGGYWNEFYQQMRDEECAANAKASLDGGLCDMPTFVNQPWTRDILSLSAKDQARADKQEAFTRMSQANKARSDMQKLVEASTRAEPSIAKSAVPRTYASAQNQGRYRDQPHHQRSTLSQLGVPLA